jgi:hypothetical protein
MNTHKKEVTKLSSTSEDLHLKHSDQYFIGYIKAMKQINLLRLDLTICMRIDKIVPQHGLRGKGQMHHLYTRHEHLAKEPECI